MTRIDPPLVERSLYALKWNYLGVAIRVVSQLVAQISLARLLDPDSFGVFAIALLCIGLGGILTEMGLGSALVQQQDLQDVDIRLAYTRIVLASMIVAVTTYFLSSIPAAFFGDSRVATVIRWMAPVFVLQALGVVPLSLLKRNLDFKAVQIVQLIAYVIGYVVVGISCALLGAGVLSLVAAANTTHLLVFVMGYAKTRHSMLPRLRERDTRLTGFGLKVALTNVANWVIENVDNLLVGKLFGAGALGLYSVSYNLVRNPTNHIVVSLQTVLFPASSRIQGEPDTLRRGYLLVASAVALVSFPAFLSIGAVSDTVVNALFGARWTQASGILLPLALAMVFHTTMAVAGPMLWGIGRPGAELKVQAWVALMLVVVLLLAAQVSLEALAWGVFAVYGLRAAWITSSLLNGIRIPFPALLYAVRGGLLLAAAVPAILFIEDYMLRTIGRPAPYRLGLEILSAPAAWLSLLLAAPNTILTRDLARVAQRLIKRNGFLGHSHLLRRLLSAHSNAPA